MFTLLCIFYSADQKSKSVWNRYLTRDNSKIIGSSCII